MTSSSAAGASMLAHGLHYAMVLAGLWGLAALLLPHALDRVTGSRARAVDEHDRRVAALRAAVADGSLGTPRALDVLAGTRGPRTPAAPATPATLWLPLAVVATCAAAGIHAAVAPPHLREQLAAGTFFVAAALAQATWAALAVTRPTRALLETGIALHVGLLALWLVTRTVGLPGVLPAPHPVGGWDLACAAWQVLAVVACARTLHDGVPPRACPGWFEWHPAARAAVGAVGVSLVLLTLTGAHS